MTNVSLGDVRDAINVRGGADPGQERRVVVEIREDLHQELGKTAIMNDLKLYVLANTVVGETLNDQEKLKTLLKKLKF